jgi:Protein of unknown function (DUF2934)
MVTPRRRRRDQERLNQIGTLTTVPTATGDIPNPVENFASREPTQEDIARRAHQLYKERGGEHGRDWEDWFQAERELRHLALLHSVVDRTLASEGPYAAA